MAGGPVGPKGGYSNALCPKSYPSQPPALQAPPKSRGRVGARQGVRGPSNIGTAARLKGHPPLKVMGAFLPPPNGVCPLGGLSQPPARASASDIYSLPPPQKKPKTFAADSHHCTSAASPNGGLGAAPTPCPDIWVSLSLHISSPHLKPFFSWQK